MVLKPNMEPPKGKLNEDFAGSEEAKAPLFSKGGWHKSRLDFLNNNLGSPLDGLDGEATLWQTSLILHCSGWQTYPLWDVLLFGKSAKFRV